MTYSEKLKDPRWQKKRLEIMERDDFMCVWCQNTELPLHVHHLKYDSSDPWDAEDKYLITVCEECHSDEHDQRERSGKRLLSSLRAAGLTHYDIDNLSDSIEVHKKRYSPGIETSIIWMMLKDDKLWLYATELYFKYLHIKTEEKKNVNPIS